MVLPLLIAAGIAAAGSVIGGAVQSSAANKATKAQQASEQAARQALEKGYERARQIQDPYVQGGYVGYNALTRRLGLPTAGIEGAQQQTQPRAAPSPQEILRNRPDVLAEYQRLSPNNLKNNLGVSTPEEFANWWWEQSGQFEQNDWARAPAAGDRSGVIDTQGFGGYGGNALSGGAAMGTGESAGTFPATAPGGADTIAGGGGTDALGNALTPGGTFGNTPNPAYTQPAPFETTPYAAPTYQAPPAYEAPKPFETPAYTAPTFDKSYTAPTFDRTYTEPTYQGPGEFSFSVDSFKDNPAFKFALDEGTNQVLASASATGARQSGAALKELQDRGQKTAYSFYAPERDAAYGRYADQRDFGRSTFDADRGFGYGAYRDARGDFESDRGFGYNNYRDARGDFQNDRDFGRGTFENDRGFGYEKALDERNFGRDTFENDRNFGRDTFENDRGFGRTTYQDDRDFDYGKYIDNTNRDRAIYESDRGYLTGRRDRETDDLFRYTAMGQGAAGMVTNAALGEGSDIADSARRAGDTTAGNALQQGSIWSGVAGDVAGIASSYLSGRGNALKTASSYVQGAASQNPYLF